MRIRASSSLDQRGASKRISSGPAVCVLHCIKAGYTAAVHLPVSVHFCFAKGRRSYTCACSSGARACSLRQKPASIARVVDVMRNASPVVRSVRSRSRNGRSRCRNRRSRSRNGRSPSSEIRSLPWRDRSGAATPCCVSRNFKSQAMTDDHVLELAYARRPRILSCGANLLRRMINAQYYSFARMWPVDDFLDIVRSSGGGYGARQPANTSAYLVRLCRTYAQKRAHSRRAGLKSTLPERDGNGADAFVLAIVVPIAKGGQKVNAGSRRRKVAHLSELGPHT